MAASNDNKKLAVNIGLGLAAYFFVLKPILVKLGLQEDPNVVATQQANAARLDAWLKAQMTIAKQTKSDAEWKIIADQIYEDLRYSALDDNKNDAAYQVCRVKNDTDLAVLYKMFGKRREYLFGIPNGSLKDLPQFITSNLTSAKVAQINNNYQRGGLKFRY